MGKVVEMDAPPVRGARFALQGPVALNVTLAALAMVATLPGRTHGLGLVTEPLLRDLDLDRMHYAAINLWATLLGAAFCLPCGWLIDRLGVRVVLTTVLAGLGGVVLLMSRVRGFWFAGVLLDLFLLVLLTRGLGQSALSVVSLALLGKTAGRRAGPIVGIYSFLCAIGFMAAFAAVRHVLRTWDVDWRTLWAGIGVGVLSLGCVVAACVRRPEGSGPAEPSRSAPISAESFTLPQALGTAAFWVFALTTSLYGMIAAGVSLFNQSLLAERGFDRDVFLTITTLAPLIGLASNLATGWLAARWSLSRLLAVAMAVLTAALLAFPFVATLTQVYLYAVAMGAAGGMVTVLFFGVWGQVFGPAHLGKIQGVAQMLTVLASAVGPLLLATSQRWTGSYVPLFQYAAVAAGLLGLVAWFTPLPAGRGHPAVSSLSEGEAS